jgi:ABC-type multidrug transport system fused ATPase/permease subunit
VIDPDVPDNDLRSGRSGKSTSLHSGETRVSSREGRRRLTVIIITHSKEMMSIADKVFFLDRGELVEQGGFAELMARGGKLAELLRNEA